MIINDPHIEGAKKYVFDREFGKDLMRKIQIGFSAQRFIWSQVMMTKTLLAWLQVVFTLLAPMRCCTE